MPVIQNGGGGQSADETIAQENQQKLQHEQAEQTQTQPPREQHQTDQAAADEPRA